MYSWLKYRRFAEACQARVDLIEVDLIRGRRAAQPLRRVTAQPWLWRSPFGVGYSSTGEVVRGSATAQALSTVNGR